MRQKIFFRLIFIVAIVFTNPLAGQDCLTPFSLPLIEPFDNYATAFPSPCWQKLSTPASLVVGHPANYGTGAAGCVKFDFYNASNGEQLSFVTPVFNATPNGNCLVSFDLSHAPYSTAVDRLAIDYSADGGATYTTIHTYIGGVGGDMTTTAATSAIYVPSLNSQWGYRQLALPAGTNRVRFLGLSDYGNTLYIDNIMVTEPPALPAAPTNLIFSNISAFKMQLGWTDNAVAETGYRVYASANGVGYSQIASLPPGATSYLAGDLALQSRAYFKVVSVNQTGESEPLIGSELTTALPPMLGLPLIIGAATSNSNDAPADPIDGSYRAFTYQLVYTAAELKEAGLVPNTRFASLGFSVSQDYGGGSLQDYTISMAHSWPANSNEHNDEATTVVRNAAPYNPHEVPEGSFEMLDFDNVFTWNGFSNVLVKICSGTNGTYNNTTPPNGGVRGESVTNGSRTLNTGTFSCTGYTRPVAFKPQIQFGYLLPKGCGQPSAVYINVLNATGINFGWVAPAPPPSGGYDWEIRVVIPLAETSGVTHVSGHAAAGVTSVSISTTSHPTLRRGVRYRLYVKSTCTDAQWVPSQTTFILGCAVKTLPFSETFTEYNTVFPPPCWTAADPTDSKPFGVSGVSPTFMSSGSGSIKYNFFDKAAGAVFDFTTPEFTPTPASASKYVLGFDHAYASGYAYDISDQLRIRISRDGGTTFKDTITYMGGRFGPLVTAEVHTDEFSPSATQWARKFIELGPGINRVQFRGIAGYGNNLYLDNLRVEAALPTPVAPTSLTATPITTSSIKLNWVQLGTAVSFFNIYRSLDNVNFEFAGSVLGNIKTFTDALLFASTLYYYRIIAVNQLYESPALTGSFLTANCASFTTITKNLSNSSPSTDYKMNNPCADLVVNNTTSPISYTAFDLNGDINVRSITLNGVIGYSSPNRYKLYIGGDLTINGKTTTGSSGGTEQGIWDFVFEGPVKIKGNINVNNNGGVYSTYETNDVRLFGNLNIRGNGFFYDNNIVFSGTGMQKINDSSTSTGNYVKRIIVAKENGPNVIFTGSNKNLGITDGIDIRAGSLTIPTGYQINNSASSSLQIAKDAALYLGGSAGGVAGSNFSSIFSSIQLDSLSTVVYNSVTPQIIVPYTYGNLNTAAGVKLLIGNTAAKNRLLIGSGSFVTTGQYALTAGWVEGSASGYVITDDPAGSLTIKKVGTAPVTFPVGYTVGGYTPAYISNSEIADFSVNAGPPPAGGFLTPDWTVDRVWEVKRAGGGNATLQFEWNVANEHRPASVANKASGWVVGHYCCGSDSRWEEHATPVVGAGPFKASISNVNTFSPFAVGLTGAFNGIILPVRLVWFNGRLMENSNAQLQWQVVEQKGVKRYLVEKSLDGNSFERVGSVEATDLSFATYSFTDKEALPLTAHNPLYYRLKIVGNDGKSSYSQIVRLNQPAFADSKVTLYPNPATKGGWLQISIGNAILRQYKLTSATGQIWLQKEGLQTSGTASIKLPAALAAGVYYLQLQTDKGISNERVIVR